MWHFLSPEIVFGENALNRLATLTGQRVFIVTDNVITQLGFVAQVQELLHGNGLETIVFAEVEPEPSLETARRGAQVMADFKPDWIIGLGGGSVMDAAKAMRVLYERPDLTPEAINPFEPLGLGKVRLICIPTTAGTGAEVTAGSVLTDMTAGRKLEVASYEMIADIAIIDPVFTAQLPKQITADTGLDVLTHSIEGYCNTWANDFTDGLCLQATRLVFTYLPRAVEQGAADMEAREKMANAATLAGLGMGNSHIALAHAMGHGAGALFHLPHGRLTGLILPYTIEFTANRGAGRYLDLARFIGLTASAELESARQLSSALRSLYRRIGQPTSIQGIGIGPEEFSMRLSDICDRAEMDASLVTALRIPERAELEGLFTYAYEDKPIDF
jgi:alcohol dehydrogenase class IV